MLIIGFAGLSLESFDKSVAKDPTSLIIRWLIPMILGLLGVTVGIQNEVHHSRSRFPS